jgi:hypothetical protein
LKQAGFSVEQCPLSAEAAQPLKWWLEELSQPVPTNFCPALDVSKFALFGAELIGYLGAGTVLAQIPTRAEILEIAWEQDGMVKTVAFQVPLQSKPLLLALRGAVSKENRRPVKGRLRLRNDDLRAMRMS